MNLSSPIKLSAQPSRQGFSLIELLTVLAIVGIVATLGISAFKGGTNSGSSREAAMIASGMFNQARTEAIMRQTCTRVVIDSTYDVNHPQNYLHRMTVAYAALNSNGVPDWSLPSIQVSKWITLPTGVYIDAPHSSSHGNMVINFAGNNAPTGGYAYFEFSSNGTTPSPVPSGTSQAQLIFAPGQIVNQEFKSHGDNLQYGFVLNRMGRLMFYQDTASIQVISPALSSL